MMGRYLLFTAFSVFTFAPYLCHSNLKSRFSHFEILTQRHFEVRVKRNTQRLPESVRLTLLIFGRRISLSLKPGFPRSLQFPDFESYAFHANGTKSKVSIDPNDFHQGVITGHSRSWVSGVSHEGKWMIHATHQTMSFSVEPLILLRGSGSERRMVAYRHRDVKNRKDKNETQGTPFCRHFVHIESQSHEKNRSSAVKFKIKEYELDTSSEYSGDNNLPENSLNDSMDENRRRKDESKRKNITPEYSEKQRKKRGLDSNDVCDLLSIADYRFYTGIGEKSVIKVVKLLLHVFGVADSFFRTTKFNSKIGVSIRIRTMEVYTYPGGNGPEQYFNHDDDEIDGSDAMENLVVIPYFKDYCAVHMSTQRQFTNSELGLAYTARFKTKTQSGICGADSTKSLNVGMSSISIDGALVPFATYSMIIAHEMGHNFGAVHDDLLKEPLCYPSDSEGGKYIMWPTAVNGLLPNHRKFSPCSRAQIGRLLEDRSECLMPMDLLEHSLCGNGVIDFGEDCDAGNHHLEDPYNCCTTKCEFTPDSVCSPFNHPCCQNCSAAPETQTCVDKIVNECAEVSFCDGIHFHACPSSEALPNGAKCANQGECQNGNCLPFCSVAGLKMNPLQWLEPCNCTDENNKTTCEICCKNLGEPCLSYGLSYDDGTPCMDGFCKNGECRVLDFKDMFRWRTQKAEDLGLDMHMNLFLVVALSTVVCLVSTIGVGFFLYRTMLAIKNRNSDDQG